MDLKDFKLKGIGAESELINFEPKGIGAELELNEKETSFIIYILALCFMFYVLAGLMIMLQT